MWATSPGAVSFLEPGLPSGYPTKVMGVTATGGGDVMARF